MHEISLVRNIFRTLEEEFPNDIPRVRTINLTVGLLSNVQPILMQNAFQAVVEDEPKYIVEKPVKCNNTDLFVLVGNQVEMLSKGKNY
jgi:Zn finger protein HypA/HybF involved in hydrogenase expression